MRRGTIKRLVLLQSCFIMGKESVGKGRGGGSLRDQVARRENLTRLHGLINPWTQSKPESEGESKCQICVAHARCQRPITCYYLYSLLALRRFIEKVILLKGLRNINEYKWNISPFFPSSHLLEIFFSVEALLDKDLTAGTWHVAGTEAHHGKESWEMAPCFFLFFFPYVLSFSFTYT